MPFGLSKHMMSEPSQKKKKKYSWALRKRNTTAFKRMQKAGTAPVPGRLGTLFENVDRKRRWEEWALSVDGPGHAVLPPFPPWTHRGPALFLEEEGPKGYCNGATGSGTKVLPPTCNLAKARRFPLFPVSLPTLPVSWCLPGPPCAPGSVQAPCS